MKAKCKRLAGRTHVVGGTAFEFDGDGICTVVPKGRGSIVEDFKNLCKLNGVKDITHGDEGEGAPAEAPEENAPEEAEATAEPAEEPAPAENGKTKVIRRPARRKAKNKGDD